MNWRVLVAAGSILVWFKTAGGESTWVFAVEVSASAQLDPPRITLSWPQDTYGANSYTIYRKSVAQTSWGTGVTLPGSATTYTDNAVSAGAAYEYQVHKSAALGYSGYGYIYAGIQAPPTENRGKVVLVVENSAAAALQPELARLEADLVGDGWGVVRHDVDRAQSPESIRALIVADYQADRSVSAVFLFGHVPIFYSGSIDWDTHGARAMPADGYYGDIDGNWSQLPNLFPSTVELMVGRVDLADMPGFGGNNPWPGEIELLRNYLNKNHRWRHGEMTVQRRSLMGNRRGDEETAAPAASGYRIFAPSTGQGTVVEANVQDNAPAAERWISHLSSGSWLWAYGCGGGSVNSLSGLGTHGTYKDVLTTDLRDYGAKAVFVMLFGSHIGDWQKPDDFIRGFLATADYGLAACMAGRPHWFAHHTALGEPIGYGARLTMNNSTLYLNNTNGWKRAVYISLMGDPTLRTQVVKPPANISVSTEASGLRISWAAAPDTVAGYHIYRANTSSGPFQPLNTTPMIDTAFTDTPPTGQWTYLVRALKLEQGPSGSYYNLSQGISAAATWGGGTPPTNYPPVYVRARKPTPSALLLEWNSAPGAVYRVQGKGGVLETEWVRLSGPLSTDGTNATWTDPNGFALPRGFYRVLRER